MRRSLFSTSKFGEGSGEPVPCWGAGGESRLVRIEPSPTCQLLLPYDRLENVAWREASDGELIELVFLTHRVVIAGRGLHPLLVAFQALAVEWVRLLPVKIREAQSGSQPMIWALDIIGLHQGDDSEPAAGKEPAPAGGGK